jgi:hypothetical protein
MSEVLEPRLTRLDERVLAALPRDRGMRARTVANAVHGREWHWGRWGLESTSGAAMRRSDMAEVTRILRGLEHLGRAECRNGWWRAR